MDPRHDPASNGCDEQHADEPSARAVGTRDSRVRWVTAAALAISLVGAPGYLGWMQYQRHQADVAAAQALDAARQYAFKLADLSADAIDAHLDDFHAGSTGELNGRQAKFRERFRRLVFDNQVIARGNVADARVKSASPSKVVVLVQVDQAVTNVSFPYPQIDRSRIEMTMEKVDGRWLASKVTLA